MNAIHVRAATVPWIVLLASAGVWLAWTIANGYGLLMVLVPVLLLAVGLVRRVAARLPGRAARLALDAAVATACLMFGLLGGWWVLPGVIAFAVLDATAPPDAVHAGPFLSPRLELPLGAVTLAVGIGLAVYLAFAPFISFVSSTTTGDGQVIETRGSSSLPLPAGLLLFTAPAALVLRGAWKDRQRAGSGRASVGVVAVALSVVSVAGGFSIGGILSPIALLAVLTFLAAPSTR